MRKNLAVVAGLCIALSLGACGSSGKSSKADDGAQEPTEQTQEAAPVADEQAEPAEWVVCDTDTMKVTFKDLREEAGIEGVCYLYLDVENRTGVDVWFHADANSSSVNGYNMLFMQGMPTYVQPGNKAIMGIILTYKQFGATSFDDVQVVDFDLVQEDQNAHTEIARTHVRVER